MNFKQGDKYKIIVKTQWNGTQFVNGIFIREIWTLSGKRYEFDVGKITRMEDGTMYDSRRIYRIKARNIMSKVK